MGSANATYWNGCLISKAHKNSITAKHPKIGCFFVIARNGGNDMEIKINKEIRGYTESMFFGLNMRNSCFRR